MVRHVSKAEPMTTAEVAEVLCVHARTVVRMVDNGEIEPAFKGPGLRGAFFFTREECERVRLARSTPSSTAGTPAA